MFGRPLAYTPLSIPGACCYVRVAQPYNPLQLLAHGKLHGSLTLRTTTAVLLQSQYYTTVLLAAIYLQAPRLEFSDVRFLPRERIHLSTFVCTRHTRAQARQKSTPHERKPRRLRGRNNVSTCYSIVIAVTRTRSQDRGSSRSARIF